MADSKDVFKHLENVLYLKNFTPFSGLKTDELRAIAVIAREITVPDHYCIVRENDAGDSFFIVKKGTLRVAKGGDKAQVEVGTVGENEVFGEMALFEEDKLRSASIYARGECTLLVIQKDDFMRALKQFPDISIELLKLFARRLRDTNKKVLEQTQKI